MSGLLLAARRRLRHHGTATLVGATLVMAAAAFYAAAAHPLQGDIEALRARLAGVQEQLRSGGLALASAPASASEQLRQFHAFFPGADAVPQWLEKLHALGPAHGLAMPSGEYRLERQPELALARYHVTLPVSGDYTSIRQFISEVLHEVPAASLDDVQFRREPGAAHVEARLRFSFHFSTRER